MIARAAGTGVVSAAFLLSTGCGAERPPVQEKGSDLRRAAFRSFAAADRLSSCGDPPRPEAAHELQRFETLKDFARRRGAGASGALWRGENGWNSLARHGARRACRSEAEYRDAIADLGASLDGLANGIMSYEE